MSSLPMSEDESLFLLDEQPPANLQKSASFDDDENKTSALRSLERMLSASSLLTSSNGHQAPHRSLSAHDLMPAARGLPPHQTRRSSSTIRSQSNDVESFVRQFETRLKEHRMLWQKEYDSTVQRMTQTKNNEIETLKQRYESKLTTVEQANQQLEQILNQLNDENKRIKFEFEHQKQIYQNEQVFFGKNRSREKRPNVFVLLSFSGDDSGKSQRTSTRNREKNSGNEKCSRTRKARNQTAKRPNLSGIVGRNEFGSSGKVFFVFDSIGFVFQRLKKMENDYRTQQNSNEFSVNEMEKRMVDLRSNLDRLQQTKQNLEEENSQLNKTNEQLQLQVKRKDFFRRTIVSIFDLAPRNEQ